jgi:hypothetical protein
MSVAELPHEQALKSIELIGREVLPRVNSAIRTG